MAVRLIEVIAQPLLGQWAVVTGGSMGIGRAVAERFVEGGANVVIAARGQEALDDAVGGDASRRSAGPGHHRHRRRHLAAPGVDGLFEQLRARVPPSTSSWPTPGRDR